MRSIFLCQVVAHQSLRLTLGFAGLRGGVHLITFMALTLEVSLVVDADLATCIRVLTLINVCREERGETGHQLTEGEREREKLSPFR